MKPEDFREWIERIYSTEDDELDYNQVQEQLAAYAEAVVNDDRYVDHDMEAHLEQNPDLKEVFDALRHFAALEANGELDDLVETPTPAIGD